MASPPASSSPSHPQQWQDDPDGSEVELLVPVVPQTDHRRRKQLSQPRQRNGQNRFRQEPLLFLKPPSALLSPGRPIARPQGFERCDYEGELAVVIGRRCHRQPVSTAMNYVLGYTLCNDVTVRDLQRKTVSLPAPKASTASVARAGDHDRL